MDINNIARSSGQTFNQQGEHYQPGVAFTKEKWLSVIIDYCLEIESAGQCTTQRLRELANIGYASAKKAIKYYNNSVISNGEKRGHNQSVVGTLRMGYSFAHDAYIYKLYRKNPRRPIDS